MEKSLLQEIERIEKLGVSAWYYPATKPDLPGDAAADINFLISELRKRIDLEAKNEAKNDDLKVEAGKEDGGKNNCEKDEANRGQEVCLTKYVAFFDDSAAKEVKSGPFCHYRLLSDGGVSDRKIIEAADSVIRVRFSKNGDVIDASILKKPKNN